MRGEEKGSMGSRKKVDRNQSKNTFMNEKQTNKKKQYAGKVVFSKKINWQ